ncbi:hypothetical protein [Mesorhizobium sp. dw_380]|uniref:hypothetical protein n=1 Tax=Mesorhizobium sp. dw_380 TaxID=2812001 RepID=UPI001BDEE1E4|nr:hypothetical protein [Mesorhizobium sp. dw_380]
MPEEKSKGTPENQLAEWLARETGITVEQARELVRLIGPSINSLLREARAMKQQR